MHQKNKDYGEVDLNILYWDEDLLFGELMIIPIIGKASQTYICLIALVSYIDFRSEPRCSTHELGNCAPNRIRRMSMQYVDNNRQRPIISDLPKQRIHSAPV
jgi:hypothetical protein